MRKSDVDEKAKKWKQQTGGFPGIYGTIDGTHLQIVKKPCEDGNLYSNRKSDYRINM
jgi:hypothetical protein